MKRIGQNNVTSSPRLRGIDGRRVRVVRVVLLCAVATAVVVALMVLWRWYPADGTSRDFVLATAGERSGLPSPDVGAAPVIDGSTSAPQEPLTPIAGLSNARFDGELRAELDRVDPQHDGWQTEAFSEVAAVQLKALGQLISRRPQSLASDLARLVDGDFRSSPLRPGPLKKVYSDQSLTVWRTGADVSPVPPLESGTAGLIRAIDGLLAPVEDAAALPPRIEMKVFRVEPAGDATTTESFFQLAARSASQAVQQNAIWRCRWKHQGTEAPPLLEAIEVTDFEEVVAQGQSASPFTDVTAAVLDKNSSYADQLALGLDHWRATLDWRFGLEVAGPHGLAVGDVNGDGLDDLFVCEPGGLPNRLFLQDVDGTARDVSAESGVDYLEPTHSALIVDLDNDRDQDLVMASGRFLLLMENDGSGRFNRRLVHSTKSMARSITAVDYDEDGDLDIYVCGYFPRDAASDGVGLGRPMPYHDANNGVRNYLLANSGNWKFTDVTDSVGLDMNNRRFSYAAAWEDYDNDGDLDLYVANDFGRNNLYRNDGGRFVDVAAQAGVEDISAGMSVSWGDYNRDGLPDVYVGNMFSTAGNRIAYQRKFKDGTDEATLEHYRHHAQGNSLFENAGDGTFRDVSVSAAVNMGRWAWSSNFVDINNDGWEDIVVANGMVTSAEDPGDL